MEYIVYKGTHRVFSGTLNEVASFLGVDNETVRVKACNLETFGDYQVLTNTNITRLDNELIIRLIEEGKTIEQIAEILDFPLPGFNQYCRDRGYAPEFIGKMIPKDVYYPIGYRLCPVCKRWFKNYVGTEWHYQAIIKDKRVLYCSYTCINIATNVFHREKKRGSKFKDNKI